MIHTSKTQRQKEEDEKAIVVEPADIKASAGESTARRKRHNRPHDPSKPEVSARS
jgi:hypothetical protein